MISFRPHTRNDVPMRVKWLNNKIANKFVVDDPSHITTTEEQEKWFDEYEKEKTKRFFTIYDNDKPVGLVGLSKIDTESGTANLFIMIGEDGYRGHGIGKTSLDFLIKFAFEELGLKKIQLEVNKLNKQAIDLFKTTGFTEINSTNTEINMELSDIKIKWK